MKRCSQPHLPYCFQPFLPVLYVRLPALRREEVERYCQLSLDVEALDARLQASLSGLLCLGIQQS